MTTPKTRELFILRHAKSDWDSAAKSDFDRPLAKRGKKDAPAMGKWMKERKLIPDHIVSSPAERAKQTIQAITHELDFDKKNDKKNIHFDERVYLADLQMLLEVLAECPKKANKVMLVGHNPGLEQLLEYLVAGELPFSDSGKLITTGALAHVSMPYDWTKPLHHCGSLINLTRPKDIC